MLKAMWNLCLLLRGMGFVLGHVVMQLRPLWPVDGGAMHCFVSEALVAKMGLPVKPGVGMDVTLSDGSQVLASQTCLVPLVVCSACCQALHCVAKCRVLLQLNHNVVLGIDWLQATNPVINW